MRGRVRVRAGVRVWAGGRGPAHIHTHSERSHSAGSSLGGCERRVCTSLPERPDRRRPTRRRIAAAGFRELYLELRRTCLAQHGLVERLRAFELPTTGSLSPGCRYCRSCRGCRSTVGALSEHCRSTVGGHCRCCRGLSDSDYAWSLSCTRLSELSASCRPVGLSDLSGLSGAVGARTMTPRNFSPFYMEASQPCSCSPKHMFSTK